MTDKYEWRIKTYPNAAPDLNIYRSSPFVPWYLVVRIIGNGNDTVRLERHQANVGFGQLRHASVAHAITILVAHGYPRPPLGLVREFVELNSRHEHEWVIDIPE